jgi:hypothetical protein
LLAYNGKEVIMAIKKAANKNTITPVIEVKTPASPKPRASKPVTPRVTGVKHSKVAESVLTANVSASPAPMEDPGQAIAKIAYGYWAERGYQGGNPADDWFRAEAEYSNTTAR